MKQKSNVMGGCASFFVPFLYLLWWPLNGKYYASADTSNLFYVIKRWFWSQVLNGHFPLWNDGLYGGIYQLATPAHELFSPLTFPFYFLFSGYEAMITSLCLAAGLSGLGTYLLTKKWGAENWSALAMAWTYALCGPILSMIDRSPLFMGKALYPWIVWFAIGVFSQPRLQNVLAVSGLLALLVHHGDWLGAIWGLGLMMVGIGIQFARSSSQVRSPVKFFSPLLVCLVLGVTFFALSAVVLLPVSENLLFTQRGGGFTFEQVSYYSFHPIRLISLLYPEMWGQFYGGSFWGQKWANAYHAERFWYHSLYLGYLPLFVFLIFLWCSRNSRLLWMGIGMGLLSFALSMGHHFFLHRWMFHHWSSYAQIRYPEKYFLFPLFLILGSAFYWTSKKTPWFADSNQQNKSKKIKVTQVLGGVGLGHLFVGISTYFIFPNQQELIQVYQVTEKVSMKAVRDLCEAQVAHGILAVFWLLLAIILFIKIKQEQETIVQRLKYAIPCLLLVELIYFAPPFYTVDAVTMRNTSRLARGIKNHSADSHERMLRDANLDEYKPYLLRDKWVPNWHLLDGFKEAFGYETITPQRTERLIGAEVFRHLDSWAPVLDLKYIVSTWEPREKNLKKYFLENQITPVGKAQDLNVILLEIRRNSSDIDFVDQVKWVPDAEESFKGVEQRGAQLTPLYLEYEKNHESYEDHQNHENGRDTSHSEVPLMWRVNDRIKNTDDWIWEAASNHSGFVVVRDNFHSGWKAFLDQKEVPLFRADYLNMAVYWPTGSHRLELKFTPRGWRWGAFISGLGLIILLVIILVPRWRRAPFPN